VGEAGRGRIFTVRRHFGDRRGTACGRAADGESPHPTCSIGN
jgi:hypothetical protein